MSHGNGVVDGESLPAMVPDETAIAVPCHLYPTSRIRDVVQDRKHRGAFALHDSSANGKAGEAPTKAQVSLAEYDADVSVVEAEAKARVAVAEALEAEAKAKAKAAVAKADAEARVAEAEATTKVRVAAAEALEADLKIVKLRKELEILTGECEVKEFCVFCLSARLSVCLSLPVFLTRALWGLRILCSPPFSFCFSRQACSRTAEMRSSVAGPCL